MSLDVSFDGKRAQSAIEATPFGLFRNLKKAFQETMWSFDSKLIRRRLNHSASGPVQPPGGGLRRISGTLARSFDGQVSGIWLNTLRFVYGSRGVPYAAIHEFGGTIQHPGGTAYGRDRPGGAVRFLRGDEIGAVQKLGETKAHQIQIPPRLGMFDLWNEHIGKDTIPRMNRAVKRALTDAGKSGRGR